jgi:hypothetical protein
MDKIEFLKSLGTAKLFQDIQTQENLVEQFLKTDAAYRHDNSPYLASYTDDCSKVKDLLAELEPPYTAEGKKMTVAQAETWYRKQRSGDTNLMAAIKNQNGVTFQVENNRILIEMAKKRLESLKSLLALRIAQIEFLSGGD